MNLTVSKVNSAVAKLGLMAFFPGDPEVRAGLVPILLEMIETEDQLEWLVDRALRLYSRWPGVAEIRALYCSRYKPRDGQEAYSETYPDGYPLERPADPPPPLPPGHRFTADPEFEKQLHVLGERKRMPGRAGSPKGKHPNDDGPR
jgi:hypothetical protein